MSAPHEFVIDVGGGSVSGKAYAPEVETATAAVLICQGFPALAAESSALQAQLVASFIDAGVSAVTFAPRADGRLAHEGVDDAAAAYRWMTLRDDVDVSRLGVLGVGVGALVASGLSARTDQIARLGLMFATTTLDLAEAAGGDKPREAVAALGGRHVRPRFFDQLDDLNPLEDIATHDRPTVIVHDAGDIVASPGAQRYVEALETAGCVVDYVLLGGGPGEGSAGESYAAASRYLAQFFTSTRDAEIGVRS